MTEATRTPLSEEQVIDALERHGCQIAPAARALGVTRQGLYDAMERLALEVVVDRVVRRKPAVI